MRRPAALFVLVLMQLSGPARAQTAVVCVASCTNEFAEIAREAARAAQVVTQINNQIAQLIQLKMTVASVMHGNIGAIADLGSELGGLGLANPLAGSGIGELAGALGGLAAAGGTMGALATNLLSTDMLYMPTASDWRAAALLQGAQAAATQKALAQRAMQSADARLTALSSLRTQLDGRATDVAAASQGTMRLAGETATAVAQTNQLLASAMMVQAQAATRQAQEDQRWACETKAFAADQEAAISRLRAHDHSALSRTTGTCASLGTDSSSGNTVMASADNTTGAISLTDAVSASDPNAVADDGSALGRMTSTSWGAQAAQNASALGVNPTALAATCVLESGCSANVGGSGTISGAFQMSNGTYAQTVSEVQQSNPGLASQIGGKNDPASQSIAAAQYLRDGALNLQSSGIANPTVLDVRSFYNFGPSYGVQVASAPDSALMSDTLSGMSAASLRANGIGANTTVGQWRSSVSSKIGTAASQHVLL